MTEPRRRNTRQRAAILQVLENTDDFVSAQDVHQRLRDSGGRAGLATVYRTLGMMTAEEAVDVLRKEDGELLFRLCESQAHHHHLVCRLCGFAVEVRGPAVERWTARVAEESGFTDVSHTLDLFGLCSRCAAQRADAPAGEAIR